LLPFPTQNFEAIRPRHFQIQQNDSRNGVTRTVSILSRALQIAKYVFPIANDMYGIHHARLLEDAKQKENVRFRIFRDENQLPFVSARGIMSLKPQIIPIF
jgi:hypothetical protein